MRAAGRCRGATAPAFLRGMRVREEGGGLAVEGGRVGPAIRGDGVGLTPPPPRAQLPCLTSAPTSPPRPAPPSPHRRHTGGSHSSQHRLCPVQVVDCLPHVGRLLIRSWVCALPPRTLFASASVTSGGGDTGGGDPAAVPEPSPVDARKRSSGATLPAFGVEREAAEATSAAPATVPIAKSATSNTVKSRHPRAIA